MLLKELEVNNARGDILSIPLEDNGVGFKIIDVKGTDPGKAVLVSSSFANLDGEQYHSSRREARNIIISLRLDPDYALMNVQELRNALYSYFMPKSSVTLKFRMFDRFATNFLKQRLDLTIDGIVETFDSSMFTSDPQVDISVMCFNPDFVDPTPIEFDGMTVSDLTDTTITYDGSVDTGVLLTFMPDRAVSGFEIFHTTPDQTFRYSSFQMPLVAGNTVMVNSVRGEKYVTVFNGTYDTSALWAYLANSAWLELQHGDNSLRVYCEGAPIPYKIEYTNKYGGL